MQRERGISNAFLGSKGLEFKKDTIIQRQKTDIAFHDFLKNNLNTKENTNLMLELAKFRKKIDCLDVNTVELFDFYTTFISKIQDDYLVMTTTVNDIFVKNNLQAFSNLMLMKEALGQLRGAFSAVFSQKFINKDLNYRIIHAKGMYDVSYFRFKATATIDFFKGYNKVLASKKYKKLNKIIDKYTQKHNIKDKFIENPANWYTLSTDVINELYFIENRYLELLDNYIHKKYNDKIYEIFIVIAIFIFVFIVNTKLGLVIKNSIIRNIKLLNEYKNAVDRSSIVSKTNKKGIITYVNRKFCSISGYEESELLGKPHNIVRHSSMPKEAFKDMWNTILNKKPWFGVVTNRAKDGSSYTVEVTINPILGPDGEIEEFIAIRNDITDIINLHKEIERTQEDLIFRMGEIGETRSKETGNHVKRVAKYSEILARHYGLSQDEIKELTFASPMHDIGKVGIPDEILNKPGKLTTQEWSVMKSHATIGEGLFKDSEKPLLKAAAIIAGEHHEKYDGSGYPKGLVADEIHIYGRITALADVFDALGSDRVYKKAWEDERIFELIRNERGKHFDPKLVDIFFKHLDEFLEVRDFFSDKSVFMQEENR